MSKARAARRTAAWRTCRCCSAGLQHRHMIVSPITAMHVDQPAVTASNFQTLRDRIGINATQLRQDRFLDEARETADPIRLMRLFGITSHTAICYVRAAYPERFTIDSTQA